MYLQPNFVRTLAGRLDPERLLAVDEHLAACMACAAAMDSLPGRARVGFGLGASLLGVGDCPADQ